MPRDSAPVTAAMRGADAADITYVVDLGCPLHCRGANLQGTFDLNTEEIDIVHRLVALIHENAPKLVGRRMRLIERSTGDATRER